MFAAALPLPVHQLPGSALATSIRDALVASSFHAHIHGPGPAKGARVRRPRRKPSRPRGGTMAEQAARAIRLNKLERDRSMGSGRRRGHRAAVKAEGVALLGDVQPLVDAVKSRKGWRHVPHIDPVVWGEG